MIQYKITLMLVVTVLAIAISNTVFAGHDNSNACPTSPKPNALVWESSIGDDFEVCYGKANNISGRIGVYSGWHPSFHPNQSDFFKDGKIENFPIRWYRKKSTYKFAIETLYNRKERKSDKYHVWIMANDETSLEELRILAEDMIYTGKQ